MCSQPDNANQSPSSKYPMVRRINSKLRNLGDWLLPRVSSALVRVSGERSAAAQLQGLPWSSINGSGVGPRWELMLGCFDRNRTILLANQDSNHPALASVATSAPRIWNVGAGKQFLHRACTKPYIGMGRE